MRRRDDNFLTMVNVTMGVMTANAAHWQSNTAITALVTGIQEAELVICGARQGGGALVSKGATMDKDIAEANAIDLVLEVAGYAQVYARHTNNNELREQMRAVGRTKLERMADSALPDALEAVVAQLTDLGAAAAPYGVTVAKLTTLQTAIEAYQAVMDKPRTVIITRKGANSTLPAQLTVIRHALEDLDMLMEMYAGSQPQFVTDYRNARIIIDRGGGHGDDGTPPVLPGS